MRGVNDSNGHTPGVARLNMKVSFPVSSRSFYSWELVLSARNRHSPDKPNTAPRWDFMFTQILEYGLNAMN